jgi:hypothetical protein
LTRACSSSGGAHPHQQLRRRRLRRRQPHDAALPRPQRRRGAPSQSRARTSLLPPRPASSPTLLPRSLPIRRLSLLSPCRFVTSRPSPLCTQSGSQSTTR